MNVDFAQHALDVGRRNAELNEVGDAKFRILREDCLPVLQPFRALGSRGKLLGVNLPDLSRASFDLVVLDPPRYAKSPFGLVDTVNDYQSLFKPALLSVAPGGEMLVTNNVASVEVEVWIDALHRCGTKAPRRFLRLSCFDPRTTFHLSGCPSPPEDGLARDSLMDCFDKRICRLITYR